jgi:uncharacterized protein with von Willebrand factor type A (vWA) domain
MLPATLVAFARELRAKGLSVSPAQVVTYQGALAGLPRLDLEDLYWCGRACLGVSKEFQPHYDEVFGQFFLGGVATCDATVTAESEPAGSAAEGRSGGAAGQMDRMADEGAGDGSAERSDVGAAASAVERLRTTPFDACSEDELAALRALVRRLRVRPPRRASRRAQASHRRNQIDLRRTVSRAMRVGGDLVLPSWRVRRPQARRVVLLLDVSRSMAPYSRLLLHFAYAVRSSGLPVEVVCFGTRVTRITQKLRDRSSGQALEQAVAAILDWHGGTRIADAIAGVRHMRGLHGRVRGAVVIICSDGLEQGEVESLERQMRGLRETAYGVIWVNPLAGDASYQPLARGMRAALPYVDHLVAGDSLASLENVAAALRRLAYR